MKMYRTVAALVVVSMTSACAIKPPATRVEDTGAIRAISNPSDIQTTIIKRHGDPERYCAARPGDVADTRSVGGSVGVDGAVGSDSISEGSSQGALALGGRSPAVLIVREMMYRACELSLNLNAEGQDAIDIYTLFMKEAKAVIASQKTHGTSALGEEAATEPGEDR